MNDNLTQHFTGTRQGRYCCKRSQNMEHEISQRSIGFDLFVKEAARQVLSSNSRTLWWKPIDPELMGKIGFFTIGKSIFFTGVVLSAFNFPVERKATKDGRLSSSHHLALLVEIPMKKNALMNTQFLKKCTITVIGNVIKMSFIG